MCVYLGPLGRELTSSTKFSDLLGVCVRVHEVLMPMSRYLSRLKLPT